MLENWRRPIRRTAETAEPEQRSRNVFQCAAPFRGGNSFNSWDHVRMMVLVRFYVIGDMHLFPCVSVEVS